MMLYYGYLGLLRVFLIYLCLCLRFLPAFGHDNFKMKELIPGH